MLQALRLALAQRPSTALEREGIQLPSGSQWHYRERSLRIHRITTHARCMISK